MPDEPTRVVSLDRTTVEAPRGRLVGVRPPPDDRPITAVAVAATVRAAAVRRAVEPDATPLVRADLREPVREQRAATLVVLAVDASGSMGAERRMEAAKGAVIDLLLDAYQRRDRVALIAFRGDGADVVLRPTGSVEVARTRLTDLPTGGRTPLAAGIEAALSLARSSSGAHRPLLVLVSDGRATTAPDGVDPHAAARAAAEHVRRARVDAVVVDAETGPTRLGLARELATVMSARYLPMSDLTAGVLRGEP